MGWDIWLPFKEWRRAVLDTGAERTDESGSSVADVFAGADMGGTAVGAPALPAGTAQHAHSAYVTAISVGDDSDWVGGGEDGG